MKHLIAIIGFATGVATAPDMVKVDGWWMDPLSPEGPPALIEPPQLRINVSPELADLARRNLQTPPPTPSELAEAQRHAQRAQDHLKAGEIGKAMLELRDGLSLAPDHKGMLATAALLSLKLKHTDDALTYLRRYIETDPGNLEFVGLYIGTLLRLGRFPEAEEWLRRYEPLVPNATSIRFPRDCLDVVADRPLRADHFWSTVPFEQWAGVVRWLDDEREDWSRLLGAEGFHRLCRHILGASAESLREVRGLLDGIETQRRQSNWAEVLRQIERLFALGIDTYGIRVVQAEALEQSGARSDAMKVWAEILRRYPSNVQAWVSASQVYLRNGRFEEALSYAQRARELAPREPVVDFLIASALALLDRVGEAQVLYAQLVKRRPREFRQWLESDPVFEAALDRLPNRAAYLRRLDIPPEME